MKHLHFEEIDSTNTWAKIHSNEWSSTGITVITAGQQTAGRGRFKRRWESPPHVNVYATFCFWSAESPTTFGCIPQVLACAAAQVLEKFGFHPQIKWPNDVLINKKKVAGILCETIYEAGQYGIVCGIGLNVNMTPDLLDAIDRPATSLYVEGKKQYEVKVIVEELKTAFLYFLEEFTEHGFSYIFPFLQARVMHKKGEKVQFHDNQKMIEAKFDEWMPDGTVALRLKNGKRQIYHAGEFHG